MKTHRLPFASLVVAAAVLGAARTLVAEELREEFHQTYPLEAQGRVELENVNGNVRIVTWDRQEIQVDAVKHARKQADLDAAKIDVEPRADRIRIRTKYPEGRNRKNHKTDASVDYTLTVPRQSRLNKVSTVNGNVQIENVCGDVAASSVNGAVTADGLSGKVELSTVNGSVKADFAALNKAVSLQSVNGAVRLSLPPEANADLSAHTLNGGIQSDFSLAIKKHFPVGQNLDARLGQGGTEIALSTVNGGIHIGRLAGR